MRRDSKQLIAFCERFGRLTKGSQAGKAVKLRIFQKRLLRDLANSRARRGYIQMPRKNSKSFLGAMIALHGLCADGENGAEVYSVAGSREQAGIVFEEAKRIVELGPLQSSLQIYRNEIIHRPSGSRYKALAAEAGMHEGLNPSLVIFDELHVLGSDRRLYDVMTLGSGTREAPLVLAITTPGVRYGRDGRDSVAWQLYDYAKRIDSGELQDPDFFYRIWEAPKDCPIDDIEAWHTANPGLGKFLHVADLEAAVRLTPENEFRTKRLGQWVVSQEAWLATGLWDACSTPDGLPAPNTPIVIGFDGSKSRDATALIGATVEPNPYVFVIQVWEAPLMAPQGWTVPRDEVSEAVFQAARTWDVRELVIDPSLWLSEAQDWASQKIPVVEYPQSRSRMVPATQRVFEAVKTEAMRHDGNPILARHIGNAVIKPTGQIAKETKDSGRKIDAAVATVMAYDRAASLGNVPPRKPVFVLW